MSDAAETRLWSTDSQPGASTSKGSEGSEGLADALEARVISLVERYRGARKTIEELRSSLEDRDERLSRLERQVREAERLREELRQRVVRLLDRVDTLERSCAGYDGDGNGNGDGEA